MALYQITVKKQWRSAGQLIEPGMSVQVATDILADPLLINGGQLVQDAFMRVYGVDLRSMNHWCWMQKELVNNMFNLKLS